MTSRRGLRTFAAGALSGALVVLGVNLIRAPATSPDGTPAATGSGGDTEEAAPSPALVAELHGRVSELAAELEAARRAPIPAVPLPEPSAAPAPAPAPAAGGDPQLAAAARWLAGILPAKLGQLTAAEAGFLRDLDLRGADLKDPAFPDLAALANLRSLELRGTPATDEALASLLGLANLRDLGLRGTKVTGTGFGSLPPHLESLDLTDSKVAEEALHRLPWLPSLRSLDLNRLPLGDASVEVLGARPSLRHLELDGTDLSDSGLTRLLQLNPGLRRVEVRGTKVTAAGAAAIAAAHPGLEIVRDQGPPWPH